METEYTRISFGDVGAVNDGASYITLDETNDTFSFANGKVEYQAFLSIAETYTVKQIMKKMKIVN